MFVLGIIGSIAGGKSTASAILQELGATWINADAIARSVLDRPEVVEKLIGYFGDSIVLKSPPKQGTHPQIDRAALGKLVFGDDDSKRLALLYLESVVHPIVRHEIMSILKQCSQQQVQVALLDVPLLFESHWDVACDSIWCIDAPLQTRITRVQQRGWSADELIRREANQLSIDRKRALSDLVIDNNSSITYFTNIIRQHWQSLMQSLSPIGEVNTSVVHDSHCL
ncbi:Dephospho-CoA kinase [Rubripirellula amarantea]|uniref:Dephospho-CoA kinase n=1 Tax=Rubripirellula amarantea TaxID=2527999 RepID=A0A5C5WC31_9BACT|nr:dephospho-CoA kinase [Rubripirellula amarantea]TWT48067.1 Dephospho-CoA kinase [Rubripirellula amarantea]